MCREYYLHKRQGGIFYVQYRNPENGKLMTARSTGETDEFEAHIKARAWKDSNGIPTGRKRLPRPIEDAAGIESIIKAIRGAELTSDDSMRIVSTLKNMDLIDIVVVKNTGRGAVPFADFLSEFWNYDKSEYIKDKLSHNKSIGRRYAHECQKQLSKYIKPFFGDKKLNCVTTDDLEELTNLLADRGLSTSTINSALKVCYTPLKWAYNKKIIPSNPAVGLTNFSITNKKRGILTEAEAEALFAISWKEKRAFVASLVSATTGARQGEILALRRSDIGEDTLNIAHSWSPLEGLKCPKNGHERIVPLLPEIRAALLDLLQDNPHDVADPFIFFSLLPNQPVDSRVIRRGLIKAMDTVNSIYEKAAIKAKLNKPEIHIDYRSRNIVFHSWRHYFCSKITEIIDLEIAAKSSGHLTIGTLRKYADHIENKHIKEIGNAAAQVFVNILQFRKTA